MADTNNNNDDSQDPSSRCIFDGCCCFYVGCDSKNFELGCQYEQEYCCIRNTCCLSLSSCNKSLGCGFTGDKDQGECCKIGCICCDLELVNPVTCCASVSACLCCYEVASFPLSELYVDECTCACCFVQCCPTCGVCVTPPSCPSQDKLRSNNGDDEIVPMTMDRGDGDGDGDGDDKDPAKEAEENAAAPVEEKEQPAIEGEDKEQDFYDE